MVENNPFSRRRVLKLSGATAVAAVLAGCGDSGPGEEDDPAENGNASEGGNGNGAGGDTGNGTGEENGNASEEENGNASEEGNGNGGGGEAIEPGEIMLGGQTQAWQGMEPEQIADEENPTLTLQEGESYEITWENMDGASHNIEIRDDSDEVVDDYSTDTMGEEGETQTLEFDVTSEMTQYVCQPHEGTMVGGIEVQ